MNATGGDFLLYRTKSQLHNVPTSINWSSLCEDDDCYSQFATFSVQTDGNATSHNMSNVTLCTNEYCLSEDDYLDDVISHITPKDWEWVFAVVYLLTFLLGITGNILVCFAIWRNRTMRTVTNIFILNLAVGDLVVLIICLPPTFIQDVTETWFFGHAMCKIALYLQTVSVSVSVLTLSAISVERWYAICYPLRFKSTRKRAQIIVVIIWVVSCLVALPEIIVAKTKHYFPVEFTIYLTSCGPGWSKSKVVIYQGTLMVILYIFPIALMAFTYTKIAIVLWTGAIPGAVETTQAPMMNSKVTKADEQLESRRKAAKMLITVVVVFAMCYFPVHLLNVLRYTGVLKADPHHPDPTIVLALISHLLPYINSSINPVIYNFMSAKFRKEFMIACQCCFRRRHRGRILGRNGTHFGSTSNYIPRHSSNTCTEQILMSTYQ
ncbi:hypothetical protein FSP39_025173 [Pinctada imbricata]|uniref:G-protein coupled receptors family 1 profile domain-containing protein n=1 Tax=Pinctada imbricata TaxID=66713 RepID=A0AA88XTK6_PINIB|nr:hypothetical protein FSP39_025173 [Pinctada imbricata]